MRARKGYPKELRVMAEYASSGIWVVGRIGVFRHGMIEYESLGLGEELAERFENWIQKYDYLRVEQGELDVDAFNKEGRALAVELKKHVGKETKVLFAPETSECGLGKEEEIEILSDRR